jgi:hypothetical protein
MKLTCEVTGAETGVDRTSVYPVLKITLKGHAPQARAGKLGEFQSLTLPGTAAARRTFHVGRKVEITVRPR